MKYTQKQIEKMVEKKMKKPRPKGAGFSRIEASERYNEKKRRMHYNIRICKNTKCKKEFYTYDKNHTHRRGGSRLYLNRRPSDSITCSKKCSKEYHRFNRFMNSKKQHNRGIILYV
ncbi:MAG: hypothetical protein AABY22_09790 [Nanoarchaeota archaeon]